MTAPSENRSLVRKTVTTSTIPAPVKPSAPQPVKTTITTTHIPAGQEKPSKSFAELWVDPLVQAFDFSQYWTVPCGGGEQENYEEDTSASPEPVVEKVVTSLQLSPSQQQPSESFAEVWVYPLVQALDFTQCLPATGDGDDSYQYTASPSYIITAGSPFPGYSFFCAPVAVQFDLPKHQRGPKQVKAIGSVVATGITINGYPTSDAQVKWLAANYNVQMRNYTAYWYDHQSGFFGRVGGKAKHVIDPGLPIKGALHPRSSCGDTGITINGREILAKERAGFSLYGVKFQPGQRYNIDSEGYVQFERGLLGCSMPPVCNWKHMREQRMQQLKQQGYTLAKFMLNVTLELARQ